MTRYIGLFLLLYITLLPLGGRGDTLSAEMIDSTIPLNITFNGQDIFVFGVVALGGHPQDNAQVDIIVTVSSPEVSLSVQKKNKLLFAWINTESVTIDNVPNFYAIASTKPIHSIVSPQDDKQYKISFAERINPKLSLDNQRFADGLIRVQQGKGAFVHYKNAISRFDNGLFKARIKIPQNTFEGVYRVQVLLLRDKSVIDVKTLPVTIRRAGIVKFLYTFIHQHPFWFGITTIIIALTTGWLAYVLFRH